MESETSAREIVVDGVNNDGDGGHVDNCNSDGITHCVGWRKAVMEDGSLPSTLDGDICLGKTLSALGC